MAQKIREENTMNILVKEGRIYACADKITYGVYDENFEKWRLADENDNLLYYYVDNGYTVVDDVELPLDYEFDKYFYENGEFVLNENWIPFVPEQSMEERIAELEKQLENLNGDAVWDEMALAIEEGVNEV